MNIRMPNGQIISNVPEGTTKKELATKLNNSSIWTGDKIDVALLVQGKPGDPKSGLGSWTDKTGKEKFFTEINDKEASIIDNDNTKFILDSDFRKQDKSSKKVGVLSNIIKHDKLYKRTPELANVKIEILPTIDPEGPYTNARAAFDYSFNGSLEKIIIHADRIKNKEDLLSVVLHEVQHKAHYDATVIKDGTSEYSYKKDDYSKTETPIATEALAEGQQDNYYYDSRGIKRLMSTPLNYLVTQHMKRILPSNMSTVPSPPNNPGEETARGILLEFMEEIAEVETRRRNIRANIDLKTKKPKSSAEGFFQFLTRDNEGKPGTNSSLQTAINYTKRYFGNRKIDWMDETYKSGDVMSLSYEQQMLLAVGNLMEKKGSDKLWLKFFTAKTPNELAQAKRDIYSKLHHTDTEGKDAKAIAKNMNKIKSWRIK